MRRRRSRRRIPTIHGPDARRPCLPSPRRRFREAHDERRKGLALTKTRNCLSALCLIAFSTAVCAAPSAPNDAPPPYAGDVKVEKPAPQSGPAARKPSAEEANPLLPSKADMEKAREERAHGHLPPKFDRQTKIEEVRDENNRVTEYVVTPGTTQIPYRIENRAERPIDSSPAGNSKSTLGTTKFIELGW